MKTSVILALKIVGVALPVAALAWFGAQTDGLMFSSGTCQPEELHNMQVACSPAVRVSGKDSNQTEVISGYFSQPVHAAKHSESPSALSTAASGNMKHHAAPRITKSRQRVPDRDIRDKDISADQSLVTEMAASSSSGISATPRYHGLPSSASSVSDFRSYIPAQPAAWADPGDLLPEDPERDLAIQQEAERLVAKINNSGLSPDSPEYRALWDASVAESDQLFRARYGQLLWVAHHNQAYHLSKASSVGN